MTVDLSSSALDCIRGAIKGVREVDNALRTADSLLTAIAYVVNYDDNKND